MKQAIIYTRFSPRPNADSCKSIEFQEEQCRAYCIQRGLDVLSVYRDAAMSGRNTRRPGLDKALAEVIKIRGVMVCYSLSRLSRSVIDAIRISEKLDKNNCDLVSVTEQIDTQTPMGRAIYKIMAVFAELERETTGERTKIILQSMQSKGQRVSRNPPFGFSFKLNEQGRGILIPNEREQDAVILMDQLRRSGKTYPQICDLLPAKGYKPRGRQWYPGTVRKLIKQLENRYKTGGI